MNEQPETAIMTTSTTVRSKLSVLGIVLTAALMLSACLTTDQKSVLDAMNNDRKANSRSVLPTHADAQKKAQAWAEKLAREGKLYHSNLSDGFPGCWRNLGENVGYGPSVAAIEKGYMNSPGHKKNIVSPTWNGVGVGYAKGKVNGYNVVFTVQVFVRGC